MFQPKIVKIALFVAVVVLMTGAFYAYAQVRTTLDQPVPMTVQADYVQRLTDGPLTLSGNLVIVVNGLRITTDSAVFDPASNVIEIKGGNTRIELPTPR
jgi:hypothetical protein